MAIFLLVIGVIFSISGLVVWIEWGTYEAIPFWIMGGIGFIPGSYASIVILRAYLGHKGYTYDMLPSYDPYD